MAHTIIGDPVTVNVMRSRDIHSCCMLHVACCMYVRCYPVADGPTLDFQSGVMSQGHARKCWRCVMQFHVSQASKMRSYIENSLRAITRAQNNAVVSSSCADYAEMCSHLAEQMF
jgi:hypothetical protein